MLFLVTCQKVLYTALIFIDLLILTLAFLFLHVVCYRKTLHHVTPKLVALQWKHRMSFIASDCSAYSVLQLLWLFSGFTWVCIENNKTTKRAARGQNAYFWPIFELFRPIVGYSWTILGLFWAISGYMGPNLGYFGPILAYFWAIWGLFWAILGLFWAISACFGPILGYFGLFGAYSGLFLGLFWAVTAYSGSILGYSWAILTNFSLFWPISAYLAYSYAILGMFWPILAYSWAILANFGLFWGISGPFGLYLITIFSFFMSI